MSHIYTGTSISFQSNGAFRTVAEDHPKFTDIVAHCLLGEYKEAGELVDVKAVVQSLIQNSEVSLRGSSLYYNGEVVSGLLGERIIQMSHLGLPVGSLVAFLKNLQENTSLRAINELYGFLEASKLPITEDGHFLAYKSVTSDFMDKHTKSIDNSVGQTVRMVRGKVDEDKDRTCSSGLHFAAHKYASGFGGGSDRMVVLKINPRDVVAIPSDYNNEKGRCCEYFVLEEVSRDDTKLVGAGVVRVNPASPVVPKKAEYTPVADNYDDYNLWGSWSDTFQGTAEEFPVNRQTTYDLYRVSTDKQYDGYTFCSYDVKNDNLVFCAPDILGRKFGYITVTDVEDWAIEYTHVVDSDLDD